VGHNKTCVNRMFVDAFVRGMRDIFSTPLMGIEAKVHKSAALPMFLVSDQMTYIIAPCLCPKDSPWQTGNYTQ
jgi:hypothetical protein